MSQSPSPANNTFSDHRRRPLRVGFISLTDAAPSIIAHELGLFERHGIRVGGLLPAIAANDRELLRRLFREDLHREIINQYHHLNEIANTSDLPGVASWLD